MEVDYTGAPTVASVIKQTKLSKFIIYKAGTSRNSVPVLDFSHGTSTDDAIESFNDWAKLANNNNPYEMIVFKKDGDQDQDVVPGKKKEKLIKFSFCLNGSGQSNQYGNYGFGNNNAPIGLIMENATLKAEQKLNNFMFQTQMDQMKKEIEELKEEDDDSDQLAGLANSPLMGALVEHLIGKKIPSTVISGADETQATQPKGKVLTKEQVDRIKTAINILCNYSDEIDTDLLKMAALAQNKPETFKMMLMSLRTM